MTLYDVSVDDTTLAVSPLFHIAGLNVTIPTTWMKGGRVILHRAFDARAFLDDIQEYRVTTLFGVPAMFIAMLALPDFDQGDVSTVRVAICGGSPVPVEVLRKMSDRGIPMLQGYGLTETAPVAIFLVAEHSLEKIGSCGYPPLYVEAKLVDSEGKEIPRSQPDTPGEVHMRGPNVSVGYWGNPDATQAAFDEAGWFHTGDVGQYDADGFCYIVDRLKDMIISGGENVYPAEVENVLFEHPAVADAAVVGLPHERWGEAVTAVVTLKPGAGLTLEELRNFCSERLARYKLPLELIVLDELPRGATGKIRKVDLRRELTEAANP
ncbi:MAG: AMP-binding protein, partial [Propionibacteriaceae bacterium]|nr:AMP-binding protein [Propionibacteriaceae bacterium]